MFAMMRKLLTEPVNSTVLQLPRALAASVLVSSLDFLILVFLVECAQFHPAAAAVVSYLSGGVLQYVLCSKWIFPSAAGNFASGFVAFTFLSLVGLAITWLCMLVLCDLAHVNYVVAKIISLGLSFTWNFSSRKYLLFRPVPGQV